MVCFFINLALGGYELTGTDRQAGRHAGRQTGIGRHAHPKMDKMVKKERK